jgi:hypothetical protein
MQINQYIEGGFYDFLFGFQHRFNGEAVPRDWTSELVKEPDSLTVWRYTPEIDVENNGHPDSVILWGETRLGGDSDCGQWHGQSPHRVHGLSILLVESTDKVLVDEVKTKRIFGHPWTKREGGTGERNDGSIRPSYHPIGNSMGVFKYHNLIYFDTFFDAQDEGDFEHVRPWYRPGLNRVLGVFLHQKGVTHQVCEYIPASSWE